MVTLISTGEVYTLVHKGANKCLDVPGSTTKDGTRLQQRPCNGGGAQSFRVESVGNGNFRFVNTNSSKCIDVNGQGTANGTQIQQWICNGGVAQSFKVETTSGGYARLRNPNSGKCVAVQGNSAADGALIHLWTCDGGDAQNWQFKQINVGTGGGGGGTVGGGGGSSPGCGKTPLNKAGGVNVTIDTGSAGGGKRRFMLSLPANYDPNKPHKLIFGFAGTNWVGEQIRPYLQLESSKVTDLDDEIFVYPDPLWHDFEGWGNLGGWLLGPNAAPADGDADLVFVEKLADYMEQNYCVDTDRLFATGHSWGGDFAMVVGCFLGDRFRATAPVAANRPYWFEDNDQLVSCKGKSATWVMFGRGDNHFTWQSYPGQFGDEGRDFWLNEHQCVGANSYVDLGIGALGECVEYQGCSERTRYCLYDGKYGHQIPSDYFAAQTMKFFRSF